MRARKAHKKIKTRKACKKVKVQKALKKQKHEGTQARKALGCARHVI